MGLTKGAKLWLRCLLYLLGRLCLLSLLCLLCWLSLLLWLSLRLTHLQNNMSSLKHDSPSWTTMTMLNLLNGCPLCW